MARRSRLTLCLLSSHPLVLSELQRLLTEAGFGVRVVRLESGLASDLRKMRVPAARFYLIDASDSRPSAEALVANILSRSRRARVLVVAERFTETNSFPLLRLGAKGLVPYAQTRAQLAQAVRAVAGGGFWVPRPVLSRFVDWILEGLGPRRWTFGPAYISPREQEVLEALLANMSNKEIAQRLTLSERTVKFHVSNVLAKFGVQRRTDLILLYWQSRPGSAAARGAGPR